MILKDGAELLKIEEFIKNEKNIAGLIKSYLNVFNSEPWSKNMFAELAEYIIREDSKRKGYNGYVLSKGNEVLGFTWGYDLDSFGYAGIKQVDLRERMVRSGLLGYGDKCFYMAELGVVKNARGNGYGNLLVANILDDVICVPENENKDEYIIYNALEKDAFQARLGNQYVNSAKIIENFTGKNIEIKNNMYQHGGRMVPDSIYLTNIKNIKQKEFNEKYHEVTDKFFGDVSLANTGKNELEI